MNAKLIRKEMQCKIALTEGDEGHDEDLGALSKEYRQQHAFPGRPENVTVHLLPPWLLLCILLRVKEDSNATTITIEGVLHMGKC